MNTQSYKSKLRSAVELSTLSKWERLVKIPYRTLYPRLISKDKIIPKTKNTFFDTPMKLILPEPVSTKIWRYGYFEKDVSFYLLNELNDGDIFIDVGSHFGFYSLLAAKLVGNNGKTISFEPMPETREILEQNMSPFTSTERSEIIPTAVGKEVGELMFKDFGITGSAFATFSDPRGEGLKHQKDIKVQVETLDNFFQKRSLDKCNLIKIDAENAEEDVIEGAKNVLTNIKPSLIVELGDISIEEQKNSRSRSIIESIEKDFNYQAFEFKNWEILPHIKQDKYIYNNILFRPL